MSLPAELARFVTRAPRGTPESARAREPIGDDPRALDAELAVPGSDADRDEASVARHIAKHRMQSLRGFLAWAALGLGLLAFVLALVDVSGRVAVELQTASALIALTACGLLLGWLVGAPRR